MRYNISILLLIVVLSMSCNKSGSKISIPDGTYSGAFQRQVSGSGKISNVSITFSGNSWQGESTTENLFPYPGLCNGKYSMKGNDSVTFENECAWTANFDGSLILQNSYAIKMYKDSIEIYREFPSLYKDIYKLKKK